MLWLWNEGKGTKAVMHLYSSADVWLCTAAKVWEQSYSDFCSSSKWVICHPSITTVAKNSITCIILNIHVSTNLQIWAQPDTCLLRFATLSFTLLYTAVTLKLNHGHWEWDIMDAAWQGPLPSITWIKLDFLVSSIHPIPTTTITAFMTQLDGQMVEWWNTDSWFLMQVKQYCF